MPLSLLLFETFRDKLFYFVIECFDAGGGAQVLAKEDEVSDRKDQDEVQEEAKEEAYSFNVLDQPDFAMPVFFFFLSYVHQWFKHVGYRSYLKSQGCQCHRLALSSMKKTELDDGGYSSLRTPRLQTTQEHKGVLDSVMLIKENARANKSLSRSLSYEFLNSGHSSRA